ncbi:MAG TPA: phosphatase PAP2 family protein [Zeimonas sp.]|nr:phosphatase PAP2 family protein [Zeimonas sp.]
MRAARLSAPAVLAVSCAAFAALALDVALGGPVSAIDRVVSDWCRGLGQAGLGRAMAWLSALHAPRGIFAATIAVALALLWRRDWRGLGFVLVGVPGGAALNALLKHAFERPRPDFGGVALATSDFSFPSGHVANATLLWGSVALLALRRVDGAGARLGVVAAAVALVTLVAASRLVLGAHFPSDVLAAMAEGVAWLALCAIAMRVRVRR